MVMRRLRPGRLVLLVTAAGLAALVWGTQRAADEGRRMAEPDVRASAPASAATPSPGSASAGKPARERVRSAPRAATSEPASGPPATSAQPAHEALVVRGRVVDDLGSGWSAFRLRAERLDGSPESAVERAFEGASGSFELSGLAAGDWFLTATSAEGLDSEPLRLALPGARPLTLVIARAARVSGLVLAPTGRGAAGVEVRAGAETPWARRDGPSARTADDGSFRLEAVPSGVVALVARGAGLAGGPAEVLELLPGEERTGVLLRLREGATVVGRVLDGAGRPEVGASVRATGLAEEPLTDADGRFELRGLAPGTVRIQARTPGELELWCRLELSEGEREEVLLRAPDGPPVRLHGTVSAEGVVLGEGLLRVWEGDWNGASGTAVAPTRLEDGRYSVLLPGAGPWGLGLSLDVEGAGRIGWQDRVDVPAVDDHELDLVLPLGRVAGRVVDPAGAPLPGVEVATTPERHGSEHGMTFARTDADGAYALLVLAGLHTVQAGGVQPGLTSARAEGVRVSAGTTSEVPDLVLRGSGTLEGSVRLADRTPAPEATLWALEPGGARRLGACSQGAFRFEGLAPGSLQLVAAGAGQSTRAPVAVEIAAGETRRIELVLAPATRVHVTVRDAAGEFLGCEIEASDAAGGPVALERGTTGEAWLGPLPPGRYRVVARREALRIEHDFELDGTQAERELALAFE